jgi:hypothetical protein
MTNTVNCPKYICYITRRKCTRNERIGVIWLKAGIWKLKGIRRGLEKGRCPLCWGEEDEKHILVNCKE